MTKVRLLVVAILVFGCQGVVPGVGDDRCDASGTASLRRDGVAQEFTDLELRRITSLSPLPAPLPDTTNRFADDARAVAFGRSLFFETRFSANGQVGCVTCHDPDLGWGDGRSLSRGMGALRRHSMSLWNVGHNRWFFWDGRADSLWAQALQPLEDPLEHGGSRLSVLHDIHEDPQLRAAYTEVFGPLPELRDTARFPRTGRPVPADPDHRDARAWGAMTPADQEAANVAFANVGKALGAFVGQITTGETPFDVFVAGLVEGDAQKMSALTPSARRGLKLFVGRANCHVCHSGPNFTDLEFHDNRVPPLAGGRRVDPGRLEGIQAVQQDPFNGVGRFSDDPVGPAEEKVGYLIRRRHNWSEFKTPSLRNVALTAPYMHQGQFASLDDVLHYYNTLDGAAWTHHSERILVPLGLDHAELADLRSFLESLSDTAQDHPVASRR